MPFLLDTSSGSAFSPDVWERVSKKLLAKIIEEFSYEKIFSPTSSGNDNYYIGIGDILYGFEAKRYVFDNFSINPDSIVQYHGENRVAVVDPLAFCAEILPLLDVKPITTAHFIQELGNTLLADAHIAARAKKTAAELVDLDDLHMEGETTGHPWITVNKGRIGLGYSDYLTYTPENLPPLKLTWIAVCQANAAFAAEQGLTNARLVQETVGAELYRTFCSKIEAFKNPDMNYFIMPVHPWQWDRVIVANFATDIASRRIILLGEGTDLYLPQQSVRTMSNLSHPEKPTLKLCMTILNTAVYRGIPGKRLLTAASLTTWLDNLVQADKFLCEECRIVLLGERAGIHYVHPQFSTVNGAPYQYNEMLGCLWRDSLASHLEIGETGIPLAALLHSGSDDIPVVLALAKKAGVSIEDWMRKFFDVIIPPLYHLLIKYGLAFSAHGQNALIVLKNGLPQRLALRDFIDDINVCDLDFPENETMPQDVRNVLVHLPAHFLIHFIQTTLFICVFRYMSILLDQRSSLSEESFWLMVGDTIKKYQLNFLQLKSRFSTFNLFAEDYPRLCLNRVRLFTHGYADDDERPVPDFQGKIDNPLAIFSREKIMA